eukprot:s3120_g6.t1
MGDQTWICCMVRGGGGCASGSGRRCRGVRTQQTEEAPIWVPDPAGDTAVMLIAFGSIDGAGAGIGSPCSPDVFPIDDATSKVPPGPVLNFGGGAGAAGDDLGGSAGAAGDDFAGEAADPEVLFGGVAGAATELFPDVPFGAAVGGAFTGGLATGAPPVGIGFSLGASPYLQLQSQLEQVHTHLSAASARLPTGSN